MNRDQLLQLYQIIAAILLFYAINTWLSSQGATPFLDIQILDDRRVPGALFALVICPPLLVVLIRVARLYAERFGDGKRWQAIPPIGLGVLDTRFPDARRYLSAQLIIVMMIPALSLMHFGNIVASADICLRAAKSETFDEDRERLGHFEVPDWTVLLEDGYRIDGWENASIAGSTWGCDTGVTYFPILQPIFLSLWVGWALLELALYFRYLIRLKSESFNSP